jgi:hypothetical protein
LGLVPADHRLGTVEMAVAGGLVALGVISLQQSYVVTDLTVSARGLTATVARLRHDQDVLQSNVAALQVAVAGIVTKFEESHLRKLAGREPALVHFGHIFLEELTRLDRINYIRPRDARGLNAIREDFSDDSVDFDLKQYVEITEEGSNYLALRDALVRPRT